MTRELGKLEARFDMQRAVRAPTPMDPVLSVMDGLGGALVVSLRRNTPEERWGFEWDPEYFAEGQRVVRNVVADGPVGQWNASQEAEGYPENCVIPGDVLVACNDVRGDAEALRQQMVSLVCSFELRRGDPEFTIVVPLARASSEDRWGLIWQPEAYEQGVRQVAGLAEGSVAQAYNAAAQGAPHAIMLGDRLASVNGVEDFAGMTQQLEAPSVALEFTRQPALEGDDAWLDGEELFGQGELSAPRGLPAMPDNLMVPELDESNSLPL